MDVIVAFLPFVLLRQTQMIVEFICWQLKSISKYTAVARAAYPITCHKHAKESSCTTDNVNTG